MRRVGTKRGNSEDIASWDLPPTKRPRVDTTRKKGPSVWSRITSSVGGLFNTVKRLFQRPAEHFDSNTRPPYMNSTLSTSLPGLASSASPSPPLSRSHTQSLSSLPVYGASTSRTHSPHPPSSPPHPLPSPSSPPYPPLRKIVSSSAAPPTTSSSCRRPTQPSHSALPPPQESQSFGREMISRLRGDHFSSPPVSRKGARNQSSHWLWSTERHSINETTQRERWSRIFPSSSPPPVNTHHTTSSSSLIPTPRSPVLSPPPPPPPPPPPAPPTSSHSTMSSSLLHLVSPPCPEPPDIIGAQKKVGAVSPISATATSPTAVAGPPSFLLPRHATSFSSTSASGIAAAQSLSARGGLTHSSALYSHPLPQSPPPSPLPSSDVVQRKKWMASLKADHTHSLSQHRAAVELELRHLAQCRQRRFRAEDSRVRNLQESVHNMSLISGVRDNEEEEAAIVREMGELTQEHIQMVESALSRGPGLEVLSQKFNISIKRNDVRTLAGLNWLNDEVINFYMNLIMERGRQEGSVCRVHAMSSFFYPKLCDVGYSGVRRWTKKVDIFSMDLVLYPIHLGTHWCLAAVDNRRCVITYYDSLGGYGTSCLATLRDYLLAEHKDKKKSELSLEGWTDIVAKNIPQQKNGSDCGIFMCMYARHLASNSAFNFSQEDMPDIRRHIICELVQQRLF